MFARFVIWGVSLWRREILLIPANQSSLPTRDEQPASGGRLFFVDNLRVFLTILVLIFHVMIIYSALGGWQVAQDQSSLVTAADRAFYYVEGRADFLTAAIGTWFLATTQAYFMGLFVLISAYFVLGSHERKGNGRFLKDRLVRLGIPWRSIAGSSAPCWFIWTGY